MPEKKGDLSLVNSSWVHNTSIGNTRFHSLDDELKNKVAHMQNPSIYYNTTSHRHQTERWYDNGVHIMKHCRHKVSFFFLKSTSWC